MSDLHISLRVDSDYIIAVFRDLAALQPDLLVMAGDFMSLGAPDPIDEEACVFDHLTIPPLGCFRVLGNHDHGVNWAKPRVADRLVEQLTAAGMRVWRNETAVAAGSTLVGIDDYWSPNFSIGQVMPALEAKLSAIVLCHDPYAADHPQWGKFQGWIISGNTHGGQCKPPFLPPPLLPAENRRDTSGAIDHVDGRWMYVNRGVGHLLRVRFNVRPEITLFRLTNAHAE